jgi:hypothetical protein
VNKDFNPRIPREFMLSVDGFERIEPLLHQLAQDKVPLVLHLVKALVRLGRYFSVELDIALG